MLKSKLAGLTSFIFGAPLVQHQFSGPTLSTAQAAMSTASSASPSTAKAYFANGCFWGTEVRPPLPPVLRADEGDSTSSESISPSRAVC